MCIDGREPLRCATGEELRQATGNPLGTSRGRDWLSDRQCSVYFDRGVPNLDELRGLFSIRRDGDHRCWPFLHCRLGSPWLSVGRRNSRRRPPV